MYKLSTKLTNWSRVQHLIVASSRMQVWTWTKRHDESLTVSCSFWGFNTWAPMRLVKNPPSHTYHQGLSHMEAAVCLARKAPLAPPSQLHWGTETLKCRRQCIIDSWPPALGLLPQRYAKVGGCGLCNLLLPSTMFAQLICWVHTYVCHNIIFSHIYIETVYTLGHCKHYRLQPRT